MLSFGWNVRRAIYGLFAAALVAACAPAADWDRARSAHFDVYSQAGPQTARPLLIWFEQLRAFFEQQTGFKLGGWPPLRVIAFRSTADYEPYRLRPTADAYYVGTESRNYIVMPNSTDLRVAAHEYWHFVEHAGALQLPPWLNEGLADLFASVRLGERGAPPAQIESYYRTLRTQEAIPLAALFATTAESPLRAERRSSDLFYAQCWAVTAMLMRSPEYSGRFVPFVAALLSGAPVEQALVRIYAKPLDAVERDLHRWVEQRQFTPMEFHAVLPDSGSIEESAVSAFAARSLIAEMTAASGKWDHAETLYRELAQEAPNDGGITGALATIALQKGDPDTARRLWGQALKQGISDADACYRYAVLAQNARMPAQDARPALERAVALYPHFDNALYSLALLESAAGEYEAEVKHLRAIGAIAPQRQYAYWIGMAFALNQLGGGKEAKMAAEEAKLHAATDEQRGYATQLGVLAVTDPVVQFTQDADGTRHVVTTRARRDGPEWNPFIEPGDQIRRVEGYLREIKCESITTFVVSASAATLRLSVPDPLHVQMRNAPPEFTCGPQPKTPVIAVYAVSDAASGLLRGLEFR